VVLAAITTICGLLVIYHHVVYPVLLKKLAARRHQAPPTPLTRAYQETRKDQALPSITVVIPAYNEAAVIAEKIRNLAFVDYPNDKLRVVIACDGCTDNTVAIAQTTAREPECAELNLTVLDLQPNRGKVGVLNNVIPLQNCDVIALSDASALISIDALLIAVAHFDDPLVGVVSGTYRILNPGTVGEAVYWNYQTNIKQRESALGTPLGVHGAFYLMRKSLYKPLPADTINDDFIIPMQIVEQGYRGIYEPRIMALELECADVALDQRRRRRIAAGNMQQTVRLLHLLSPRFGGVAFTFASGKALRAIMPFCLLILLLGSAYLATESLFWKFIFLSQVFVYSLALVRHALGNKRVPKILDTIHYLVSGHLSGLIGALRYCVGLDRGAWKRANIERE
jgi:cellulose synthase/poly-beta-1,6-N-acetylglucosamine synthase-like glycosyltransferase